MRPIDADVLKGCAIIRPHNNEETAMIRKFSDLVNHFEIPTLDVAPVVHGRWIEESELDENGNVIAMCNQCYHTDEHSVNIKIPYCWYCGARMDGGADNG